MVGLRLHQTRVETVTKTKTYILTPLTYLSFYLLTYLQDTMNMATSQVDFETNLDF
jgi:hypothetical protein